MTKLSTGAGGVIFFRDTCKSLEESHHHCQQSRRASSHIPPGPVLIRDTYQQEPVGIAFTFPCEYGSFTGHLLFFGLPMLSETLGSLNMRRLKANRNVSGGTLAEVTPTVKDKGESAERRVKGAILSREASKNEGFDLIERWYTEHVKELRKTK